MNDITRNMLESRLSLERENLAGSNKFIDRLEGELCEAKENKDNIIKIIEALEKDLNK